MVAIDLYQLATDPDYRPDPDPYPYRCQHCREYLRSLRLSAGADCHLPEVSPGESAAVA